MDETRKLVTVAGLDRFVGFQWKGCYCDFPGCEASHSEPHSTNPRLQARVAGWRCDETGDWCPVHATAGIAPAPSIAD